MKFKNFLLLIWLVSGNAPYAFAQKVDQQSKEVVPNPALMQGSDFLTIFQLYYKQGNWEKMMELTSTKSIKKYGYKAILEYYKEMDFGYKIRLVSMKKTSTGYIMNYRAKIQATDVIVRCVVVVERGELRLVVKSNQRKINLFYS